MLSALLIKDQNSEDNSKTYLIMLSLTIVGLQEIIPKLMALQRGWFRHAKRDFGRFASLGTKRIGTQHHLTSPWLQDVQTCLFVSFRSLLSTFWETSYSTFFHCCSNEPGCGLGLPNHLGQGHRKEGCSIQEGYTHGHEKLVHCTTLRHLMVCTHMRWQLQTWIVKWRNPSRRDDGRIQVRQVARHTIFKVIPNCASISSLQLQHT